MYFLNGDVKATTLSVIVKLIFGLVGAPTFIDNIVYNVTETHNFRLERANVLNHATQKASNDGSRTFLKKRVFKVKRCIMLAFPPI